ncbi:MAG: hypothetical protein HQL42_09930 [Alphaproteobacteria bacterium]|nr:hypothetical protein [Alphaproteobacteria bacterium]
MNKGGQIAFLTTIYPITVGACYLLGFWDVFGINALEYVAPSDLLRFAAFPIMAVGASVALGAAVGEMIIGSTIQGINGQNRASGRLVASPTARFLIRLIIKLIYCALVIFAAISTSPNKWYVLASIVPIPIYLYLKGVGFIAEVMPDDGVRSFSIYVICALPMMSYAHGDLKASIIKDGASYLYKQVDDVRWKYIGKLDDYMFFVSVDNSIFRIEKFDESITLQRFKAPKP